MIQLISNSTNATATTATTSTTIIIIIIISSSTTTITTTTTTTTTTAPSQSRYLVSDSRPAGDARVGAKERANRVTNKKRERRSKRENKQ